MKNRRDQGKGAWTRVHGAWPRILIVLSVLSLSILGMVTSGFGFALIPIATGPSKEMAVSLAYDGTRILVPVMSEYLGPTPHSDIPAYNKLHAYRLDFSGVGGSALVTTASNGLFDAVAAYGGGKYLLVWLEGVLGNPMPQGTVQTIKGAFVNPDDTVGAPFTIASGACEWDRYENRCRLGLDWPGVIYGGGKFLVVYERQRSHVYGRFIDPATGSVGSEFQISVSPSRLYLTQNQMAFDGTNFLVVYNYDDDYQTRVLGRFVNPSSGPTGTEITIDDSLYPSDNPSALIFDGTRYLVVWTDEIWNVDSEPETHRWHFYGNFVETTGTVSPKFAVSTSDNWKIAPLIVFDGQKYHITWTDGRNCSFPGPDSPPSCTGTGMDIYGQSLNRDGSLSGGEFVVYNADGNQFGGLGLLAGNKIFGLINDRIDFSLGFVPEDVYGAIVALTSEGPSLALTLNQSAFHRSQQLTLGATVVPGATAVVADVYVAVQLPDGGLLFLQGDGTFTWDLQPIVRSWPISPFTGQIFTYTFSGGEPVGNYAWLAAFTQPGTLNFIGPIVSAPFSFSP